MNNKIERLTNRILELEQQLQMEVMTRNEDAENTQIDLYEARENLKLAWADDEAESNGWK